MIWLFEKTPPEKIVKQTVCELGFRIEIIPYEDWILGKWKPPKEWELEPTLFHGSINCAKRILRETNLYPTIWLDEQYDCINYYQHFKNYLLNYPYFYLTYESLLDKNLIQMIQEKFGDDFFIRPNKGTKPFVGFCYNEEEIIINKQVFNIKNNELVLISSKKQIENEWRVFIIDNEVVSGSLYMKNGKILEKPIDNNHMAILKSKEVLNNVTFRPAPAFTIDLCNIKGSDKVYILELNAFNTSGVYACDCKSIVEKISNVAIGIFNDQYY